MNTHEGEPYLLSSDLFNMAVQLNWDESEIEDPNRFFSGVFVQGFYDVDKDEMKRTYFKPTLCSETYNMGSYPDQLQKFLNFSMCPPPEAFPRIRGTNMVNEGAVEVDLY